MLSIISNELDSIKIERISIYGNRKKRYRAYTIYFNIKDRKQQWNSHHWINGIPDTEYNRIKPYA